MTSHPPSADQVIRAELLVSMRGEPIRDGALACRGETIVALGEAGEVVRQYPDAPLIDLGRSVLLPGLINAHTHLELSHHARGGRPGRFSDWIGEMARAARSAGAPEAWVPAAARTGALESLAAGVTCVGDITAYSEHSRAGIGSTGLRAVSFAELLGLGKAQNRFDAALARAAALADPPARIRPGLSPHAPYTVAENGYRQALVTADELKWPVATHLAESLEEAEFVAEAAGDFRTLWERLGQWSPGIVAGSGESPVAFAQRIGLLARPDVLLAHLNYADDGDLALLAGGRASVVYCPQTHAWFGHPPHRLVEMLGRGINVCIGTDSRASSATLNPLDDLTIIRRNHSREAISTRTLWSLVTTRAARPLGLAGRVGELAAGAYADLAAFPLLAVDPDESLEAIVAERVAPVAVLVGGERIQGNASSSPLPPGEVPSDARR